MRGLLIQLQIIKEKKQQHIVVGGPFFLGTSCLPSKNFKVNLKNIFKQILTTSKNLLIKSKYPQPTNAISIAPIK
jgi:hypothetical protein